MIDSLEDELAAIAEAERRLAERRREIARLVPPQPIAQARPRPAIPPPAPSADKEDSGVFRLPVLQEKPLTREQLRSRRVRQIRARTVSVKRLPKRVLEVGRALYPDAIEWRPRSRSDCAEGPRPCPFVACRYNLYLDVGRRTGSIKLNFPDLEPEDVATTCALDIADRGGATLEEVGALMNITRERVRQIEVKAFAKLEDGLTPWLDPDEQRTRTRAHQDVELDELEDDDT